MQDLLLRELRKAGFTPVHKRVEGFEEMIEALNGQDWDVVLSDYIMPSFSGLAALKLLRDKCLDLPFLMVSGQIGEDIAVEAMKAGANDYIMKDNLKRLAPAIKRELAEAENRKMRRQAEEELKRSATELRALAQIKELNRQNSIISEMRELLQSISTIQEMPPIISVSVTKLFPNAVGAIFLMNNSRTDLQSVARWGNFPEDVDDNIFKPDSCWGLRRGRIHVVEDVKIGPICPHFLHPIPTPYMCLPLIAKGDILGLLHLRINASIQGEAKYNTISEMKESAVIFAEYLSLSIANIKLWEKLADQSIRDPLTGLFNRRYMEETIQREILRAARKQTKIGIIMADIDHFKKFNDTYGHKAGDELLIRLADFFKLKMRGSDIACRYGGEEFILILPESSGEDTYKRADNLREEVKNLELYYRDQHLPSITLSIGIATYPDSGEEFNELIRVADTALYKAKEQGRDTVIRGSDTPASPDMKI